MRTLLDHRLGHLVSRTASAEGGEENIFFTREGVIGHTGVGGREEGKKRSLAGRSACFERWENRPSPAIPKEGKDHFRYLFERKRAHDPTRPDDFQKKGGEKKTHSQQMRSTKKKKKRNELPQKKRRGEKKKKKNRLKKKTNPKSVPGQQKKRTKSPFPLPLPQKAPPPPPPPKKKKKKERGRKPPLQCLYPPHPLPLHDREKKGEASFLRRTVQRVFLFPREKKKTGGNVFPCRCVRDAAAHDTLAR